MIFKSQVEKLEVDVYCEHLLSIRQRDPDAFRLLRKTALEALATYEDAKRKAVSFEEAGKRSRM